jgi:hypothetical protein
VACAAACHAGGPGSWQDAGDLDGFAHSSIADADLSKNNYLFDKKKGKKFFLFIGHKVLFFETPFLHRARRNYVCGATAFGET